MKKSAFLLILVGCQSVFFQPDHETYLQVSKIPYKIDEITVSSPGEPDLACWYVYSGKSASKALIVQFHGNAQNMTAHVAGTEWFLKQGWDVFAFDYRGYGRSQGVATREGTIDDGLRVLEYLAKTSSQEITILGQSLGGAIATVSLAKSPYQKKFKRFIFESSFGSYRRVARKKAAVLWLSWPLQYPLSWLFSDDLSPRDFVDNLTVPTWVVHGDEDPVVPVSEGKFFFDALPTNLQKKISIFSSKQHLNGFYLPTDEVAKEFLSFP